MTQSSDLTVDAAPAPLDVCSELVAWRREIETFLEELRAEVQEIVAAWDQGAGKDETPRARGSRSATRVTPLPAPHSVSPGPTAVAPEAGADTASNDEAAQRLESLRLRLASQLASFHGPDRAEGRP